MKNKTITSLIITLTILNVEVFGQNIAVNMVILCNEKLINSQLSNVHFVVTTDQKDYNLPVDYLPGDLLLPKKIYDTILSDSVKSLRLFFDLNTFNGQNHYVLNIKTDFPKGLFDQPYLVLNVFDFKEKKYRRQFSYLTEDEFICEFSFPNSGTRLIRR